MRGSHVLLALFALGCSSSVQAGRAGSTAGCTKDTDCEGDRICAAGRCVAPDGGGGSGGTEAGSGGTQQVCGGQSFRTLQCELDVPTPPEGMPLDIDGVALAYTPSATGVEAQIPKLHGPSDCALNMGDGWFFDSPSNPTKLVVCPGTCSKFDGGAVNVLTGCLPLTGITQ